ncbi:MAG: M23 family metallopeptidase [Hyphomonadaceae bacterium]|nr:M23 family metallopeptidase [Hyphomonadaceae bacterium]
MLLLLGFLFAFAPRPAAAQQFDLPIACSLGADCIVQNYVDADPRPNLAEDPMCGPLSYDGHDGLDIRVPTPLMQRGVAVLAPAAGVVAGARDGEPDGAFLQRGEAALNARDCGNGVRIDHGGGWSSQLCHMRNGSLRVRVGDRVTAGQTLGLVGLSGRTEFPHLHLSLTRGGVELDPLTGRALTEIGACGPSVATPGAHWSAAARSALSYRSALWFQTGFTGAAPAADANVEALPANASRQTPLVYWGLAAGPREGDTLRVRLYGPDGALMSESTRVQPRDQAQASVFAGRRAPPGGWPAGAYRGEATLTRDGAIVSTRNDTLALR